MSNFTTLSPVIMNNENNDSCGNDYTGEIMWRHLHICKWNLFFSVDFLMHKFTAVQQKMGNKREREREKKIYLYLQKGISDKLIFMPENQNNQLFQFPVLLVDLVFLLFSLRRKIFLIRQFTKIKIAPRTERSGLEK